MFELRYKHKQNWSEVSEAEALNQFTAYGFSIFEARDRLDELIATPGMIAELPSVLIRWNPEA